MSRDRYTIGRGKPPVMHQYQPGQSGNPAGRPKSSKNFKTDFLEEIETKVEITEGGKKQEVTKQRALIIRLINMALSGNLKAAEKVINLNLAFTDVEAVADQLSAEELKLLEDFIDTQRGDNDPGK